MHEMAITQALLDMAVENAREAGAAWITQINLVIGDMSSVLDESVQFYFDFISKETPAERAKLVFTRVPLKVRCRQCATEFQPGNETWKCPQCGNPGVEIIAGNEFYMESIEVE